MPMELNKYWWILISYTWVFEDVGINAPFVNVLTKETTSYKLLVYIVIL